MSGNQFGCCCGGYSYAEPVTRPAFGFGRGFSLIVVLFILLIIVGAAIC
ncbi:YjcZ family sporulation protein [Virgibacillus sp. MSJ-26]|nr:YjcZ family sporulation protein [Virgibacillus sp. MSJ-26]MBU5466888.1 YjcZ family sporulation protein [Virgibacillus sp. MSJ-26]